MSIDEQELRAIQFLAQRVRRATPGAATWDDIGLAANLRKIQNRNLHMTIEHVLRHAADPKANNPGVLLGSFTPAAPTEDRRPVAPKRNEACLDCGRHLDECLCGSQRTRPREALPEDVVTACADEARALMAGTSGEQGGERLMRALTQAIESIEVDVSKR